MYGRILRQLREAKGRSQADVAREVGISPAHLARLERDQRGLYVKDFVRIAEVLGEKAGDLLPNALGEIGHLKPLIGRIAAVRPELLAQLTRVVDAAIGLIEQAAKKQAPPRRTRR